MLFLQVEACSFQLGTNLSGKLLRRLFLSSVKSLASIPVGFSGGDVFQLFMACWRLSRVRGEGVDSMSSKLIRCPPQSNELRPGLLGESVGAFFWLNAAARREVAAPVMLWAPPEEAGKLYLDDGGELEGETVLMKLTPEPSSVGMTVVVPPTSTLIMSESIRFDPCPGLGMVTEGVCCGGRVVAPRPGIGGRFFSFE